MNAKPNRTAADLRGGASGAPRPGGRAAARDRLTTDRGAARDRSATDRAAQRPAGTGPAQEYATRGTAALAPQRAQERPGGRLVPWLKVAPPMPVSVPRTPFILLLLLVVVGGVLGILLVNTKVNENAFQMQTLEREQEELDRQEQDLKQQIANYEAPNNLAAEARRLGLVPADSPAFIRLPDGRIIGVPRPAGGEPSITSGDDAATGTGTGTGTGGERPAGG